MPPIDAQSTNLKGLRRLYQSDSSARALFDHVAARKNNSAESTVDRLLQVLAHEGHDVSRRDLIAVLQSLESHGIGEFIVGRRGQPSRFRWLVGMIGLGKVVRGEPNAEIEPIDETEIQVEPNGEDLGERREEPGMIGHVYQLRPETQIKLVLPANLSTKEAQRLAEFIKTLPFDEIINS